MEYSEDESEESETDKNKILKKVEKKWMRKTNALWSVITDLVLNSKQETFKQKIGKKDICISQAFVIKLNALNCLSIDILKFSFVCILKWRISYNEKIGSINQTLHHNTNSNSQKELFSPKKMSRKSVRRAKQKSRNLMISQAVRKESTSSAASLKSILEQSTKSVNSNDKEKPIVGIMKQHRFSFAQAKISRFPTLRKSKRILDSFII